MVECKYLAVEGCRKFSEAALFVYTCMYAVTASMEASTSHTLDFFNPFCLSEAKFSSDVPAAQFCFRVCLICSSEFLFVLSEKTHLHNCHSFDNQFFFSERAPLSFEYPVLVPLTCREMKAHSVKVLWELPQTVTSEKRNQLSISSRKSGGIVEGLGLMAGQGKISTKSLHTGYSVVWSWKSSIRSNFWRWNIYT